MWIVYILQCADSTYYTGITKNVTRRLNEHNNATIGSKYVRVRRPVKLVYKEDAQTRSQALKREAALKKLSRAEKIIVIQNYLEL